MINPEDSQMSVDAEPDAPDTALKSSCQRARWLTGTGNLAAALEQKAGEEPKSWRNIHLPACSGDPCRRTVSDFLPFMLAPLSQTGPDRMKGTFYFTQSLCW